MAPERSLLSHIRGWKGIRDGLVSRITKKKKKNDYKVVQNNALVNEVAIKLK